MNYPNIVSNEERESIIKDEELKMLNQEFLEASNRLKNFVTPITRSNNDPLDSLDSLFSTWRARIMKGAVTTALLWCLMLYSIISLKPGLKMFSAVSIISVLGFGLLMFSTPLLEDMVTRKLLGRMRRKFIQRIDEVHVLEYQLLNILRKYKVKSVSSEDWGIKMDSLYEWYSDGRLPISSTMHEAFQYVNRGMEKERVVNEIRKSIHDDMASSKPLNELLLGYC